jgi:hypothetical protein
MSVRLRRIAKLAASGALAAGALLVVAPGVAPAGRGGRLCVARTMDEGAMNTNPVRVWGEQGGRARQLAALKGGEKACARVAAGRWSLDARSRSLAAPRGSDPEACRSAALVLDVAENETVTVTVTPLGRPPTYHCGWDLR